MSSSSPLQSRPSLDQVPRGKPAHASLVRGKSERRPQVTDPSGVVVAELSPRELASVFFDQACVWFDEKNAALALTISEATGSPVSESVVGKWRKQHERELPNYAQVLALGPVFLRLLKKAEDRHFGWSRQALMDVAAALGELAVSIEE